MSDPAGPCRRAISSLPLLPCETYMAVDKSKTAIGHQNWRPEQKKDPDEAAAVAVATTQFEDASLLVIAVVVAGTRLAALITKPK